MSQIDLSRIVLEYSEEKVLILKLFDADGTERHATQPRCFLPGDTFTLNCGVPVRATLPETPAGDTP